MNPQSAHTLHTLLFSLGLGFFFFFRGFRQLKLRRQAMSLATSKARSMAMGTVEISGIAVKNPKLIDPIYKQPCAYFRIKVERHQESGKNSKWVTIHSETSEGMPFLCKDATGQVLILPKKPEIHLLELIESPNSGISGGSLTPAGSYLSRWGGGRVRVKYTILRDNDPLYIIGCALPMPNTISKEGSVSATEAAIGLKNDKERMKQLDTNNDGHVDEAEWTRGLEDYKIFCEEKKKREAQTVKPEEPIQFSGLVSSTADVPLIIAHSEEDLVRKLGWGSFLMVLFGAAGIIFGLVLLFQKLS